MLGLFLVFLLALAVFAGGWWVSRPMPIFWRWFFRLTLLAMVAGLMLPSVAIDWLRDALSLLLPLARDVTDVPGISIWVHYLLFSLVSGLLLWHRRDLPLLWVVVALASLAFITEGIQLLIDGRFAAWADVLVNLCGVATGLALRLVLSRMR
ncbi:MAG: hypothetical protein ACNA7J_12080 [Wenzhouxiangella sp.]